MADKKKPLSGPQAAAMMVIQKGGRMALFKRRSGHLCFRLLDHNNSPVGNIQERTGRALIQSQRVIKDADGSFIKPFGKRGSRPLFIKELLRKK